jgi:endonuclease III
MELITSPKAKVVRTSLLAFDQPADLWRYALNYVTTYRKTEFEQSWDPVLERVSKDVPEETFFKEFVWVCYVSGFSARVISKKLDALLKAHKIIDEAGKYIPATWNSLLSSEEVASRVYPVFKNQNKARAVQRARREVAVDGWAMFHNVYVRTKTPRMLRMLYGVGPVLAYHLARNLGNVDVVKPDLHLNRLANHLGLHGPRELCQACADLEDPPWPVGKVDLVLWLAAVDCGTL